MSQSREVISSSALDQMTAGQRLAKARSAHLSPHSKKPELPATAHSQRANSGITKLLGPARGPKHLRCTMDYTSGDFGELDSSRLVMMETGELARWIERQRDMTMFHPLNSKALLEARCLSSAISLLLLLGLASVMGCKRDPSAQAEEAFARAWPKPITILQNSTSREATSTAAFANTPSRFAITPKTKRHITSWVKCC